MSAFLSFQVSGEIFKESVIAAADMTYEGKKNP
jgi:hypothetical protein